jgi:hypothetical protein
MVNTESSRNPVVATMKSVKFNAPFKLPSRNPVLVLPLQPPLLPLLLLNLQLIY